jgi:hypothetical protein
MVSAACGKVKEKGLIRAIQRRVRGQDSSTDLLRVMLEIIMNGFESLHAIPVRVRLEENGFPIAGEGEDVPRT